MIGIAMPNFVIAPMLTLVFGLMLGWLPVGGWGEQLRRNVILPVDGARPAAGRRHRAPHARQHDRGAAQQLHPHRARQGPAASASRSRATPCGRLCCRVVSYLGPAVAGIITGSIVIEQIFGIPGIGRYFVQGALNRDYTLVMGVTIFYGALIILFNLVGRPALRAARSQGALRLSAPMTDPRPRRPHARAERQGPQPVGGRAPSLARATRRRCASLVVLSRSSPLPASSRPGSAPHPLRRGRLGSRSSAPPDFAAGFYFGTDANGRDLFVRTLYGGRVSLIVGAGGDAGQPRHRRRSGAPSPASRRPHRRGHDAHRRHPLRAALHVLRDPADGRSSAATSC